MKIPEPDDKLLALERRIVYYLYNLDGASKIFETKEKDAVIKDFTESGIFEDNIIDNNKENKRESSIELFKEWYNENHNLYKKALTQYIKDNRDIFNPFVKELLALINERRATKALPPLSIPGIK